MAEVEDAHTTRDKIGIKALLIHMLPELLQPSTILTPTNPKLGQIISEKLWTQWLKHHRLDGKPDDDRCPNAYLAIDADGVTVGLDS